MNKQQAIRTVVIAGVAAGAAFFGASWDSGFTEAVRTAGTAFFGTAGALLGYLGWDARKKS